MNILSGLLPLLSVGLLLLAATQDYVGSATRFVTALSERHFDDASKGFNEKMAKVLPPEKLKETWDGLLGQVGDFKKIVNTRTQEKEGYQIVFVTCAFAKTNLDAKVVFDGQGMIAGVFFVPPQNSSASWSPPSYIQRTNIREQSVTIGKNPWKLPGILTLPVGRGPFPGVLLVQGSGPQDMDETVGANKPFKDLAWGLASRGIVVLRYSKRTLVYGAEMQKITPLFTVRDETIEDAQAAADLLIRSPEVESDRIYLIGHSLGGMLAPRIAAGDSQISGIVILAGPARPIEQYLVEQTKYLAQLAPDSEQAQQGVKNAEEIARQIDNPKLKPESIINLMGAHIPGSYWIDLRNYNAVECAARLGIPILVLQGGHDYEVGKADLKIWEAALGRHSNASFKLYTNLNHLFMPSLSVSTPAEYDYPGHVAQEVIDDIAAWIMPTSQS